MATAHYGAMSGDALGLQEIKYVFNVEVFNTCQVSFWLSNKAPLFGGGNFTKMCHAKFPPVTLKASPKIACHKIQWLQFANRNIARLRSRHSGKHSQNPITTAISTM